jgi:predicted nucleic acid-binding protein
VSRIYWDTMLFIYLIEEHPDYYQRVRELLDRSFRRNDSLFTSYFALGEVLAGAEKSANPQKAPVIRQTIEEMGFSFLAFDAGSVAPFSKLRAVERLKAPDAIQLACAASAGIDLFLTGDKQLQLMRLDVPGIQFIADFNAPIL